MKITIYLKQITEIDVGDTGGGGMDTTFWYLRLYFAIIRNQKSPFLPHLYFAQS